MLCRSIDEHGNSLCLSGDKGERGEPSVFLFFCPGSLVLSLCHFERWSRNRAEIKEAAGRETGGGREREIQQNMILDNFFMQEK